MFGVRVNFFHHSTFGGVVGDLLSPTYDVNVDLKDTSSENCVASFFIRTLC